MLSEDSDWLLPRLPGRSQLLAVHLVHQVPVLRLTLLAAVLQHLAPPTLLQAFRLHLLPVKGNAVGALVIVNSSTDLSEIIQSCLFLAIAISVLSENK